MNETSIRERCEVDWNDDKQILEFVENRWKNKDEYKGGLEKKWLKIIATYEGFPYLDFDEARHILTNDLQVPEWRVNLTVNLLLPKIRTYVAKLLRNRPIWDVLPATSDVENINRALRSKKTLQSYWYSENINYLFVTLLYWIALTGNGYVKVGWNPDIGPELIVALQDFIDQKLVDQFQDLALPNERKQALILKDAEQKFNDFVKRNGGANFPLGEVESSIPSPFDIVYPYEEEFKNLPWLIHAQVRELSFYSDIGLDIKQFSPPTEKESRYMYYARRNYNLFNMGYGSTWTAGKTREVLELHLWLKKSRQHRNGFHAVIAGGNVLRKEANPYNHGCFPLIHFRAEETPGKITGFSAAEMAIPVISEYQKTKSQITEIKNLMAKPKWLVPRSARISENALTSEPGEVVEYAGVVPPSQVTPVSIPSYLQSLLAMDKMDIDDIMAVHDASKGVNPSGSRSGLMNVNLQEQDEGQLAVLGLNLDTGLAQWGRLILSIQDQFYREDRLQSYVGEKGRYEIFNLEAGSISGPKDKIGVDYFKTRVTTFSQFGLSRAGQLEALKSLLQYQIFKPEDRDKIFKFLQIGWMEDELDEFQIDRSNAYKENQMMMRGMPLKQTGDLNTSFDPDFSDADKIHLEEHAIFQKGEVYRMAPPQVQMLFQKHIQAHKLFMVTKMVEPQVLGMSAQVLAATLNGINPQLLGSSNAGNQGSGSKGSGSKGSGNRGSGEKGNSNPR